MEVLSLNISKLKIFSELTRRPNHAALTYNNKLQYLDRREGCVVSEC